MPYPATEILKKYLFTFSINIVNIDNVINLHDTVGLQLCLFHINTYSYQTEINKCSYGSIRVTT